MDKMTGRDVALVLRDGGQRHLGAACMTCGSHQDVRYTTEELLDITAQYATEEDAVGVVYAPGDKEEVPGSN
jgi:hypothetical protein